ncbi:extracellular solute-binding protein [Hutsoniella sourekii]
MIKKIAKKSVILLAALTAGLSGFAGIANAQTKIEYWHGNAETQGGKAVTELVEKFNASQDEVVVEPIFHEGLYVGLMQSLQTQAAAGEYPALVQIGWAYREYFATNFPFMPPADLIKEAGEDEGYLQTKFPEQMLNFATDFEGNQLGFPYSVSTAVVYVNTELAEEAGVNYEEIETWADLYEAAAKVHEATGKYGLYTTESNDNWSTQQIVETYGAETVTSEGTANFATEEGIQGLQDWADSIESGATLHASTDEGHQAFISGDVAFLNTTIAQRTNVTENAQFEAVAIDLPSKNDGSGDRIVPPGGSMLAVTGQDPEQRKAAWQFIKFLYEPDSIAIWTANTGYLPPTADATENADLKDLIENDQMFQTAYSHMEDLRPFASFPGNQGLQASDVYRDARDKILNGQPAKDVLPKTQEQINDMIK